MLRDLHDDIENSLLYTREIVNASRLGGSNP